MNASTPPDMIALAAEACAAWQKNLSATANDPAAKAELMKLMEPSRQVFAEWSKMMKDAKPVPPSANPQQSENKTAATPHASENEDQSLRLAQLAHRIYEFEKDLIGSNP
jgi:hypothetical protein